MAAPRGHRSAEPAHDAKVIEHGQVVLSRALRLHLDGVTGQFRVITAMAVLRGSLRACGELLNAGVWDWDAGDEAIYMTDMCTRRLVTIIGEVLGTDTAAYVCGDEEVAAGTFSSDNAGSPRSA